MRSMRPGPQQRLVEGLGQVRRHHREDAVLRRRLRAACRAAAARSRLSQPRGFFRPDISVSSACSVPMPPPPMPPMMIPSRQRLGWLAGRGCGRRGASSDAPRCAGSDSHRRCSIRRSPSTRRPSTPRPPASLPAVAERVGLVEEHDDAAVAEGELAQLPEQAFTLRMPTPMNIAWKAPGSTNTNGRPVSPATASAMQRLAGAGRTPQQDAAGHVAALAPRSLGLLEEDDALLHPGEHRVLAPDVGEAGLDVVGAVDVDAAARQEPEHGDELADDEEEPEHHLEDERQASRRDRRRGRGRRTAPGTTARPTWRRGRRR